MRPARARVVGRFDRAGGARGPATVVIDRRGAGLFAVRPYRSRRVYALPLATVAEIVVQRCIRAELAQHAAADAVLRRAKRGRP